MEQENRVVGSRIFVDLDGTLADFDSHYADCFGVRPSTKNDGTVDWAKVRALGNFYWTMPPMADMGVLWGYLAPLSPIVLTGIPHSLREEATANKTAWVRKHLGLEVEVRCVPSREKYLHCQPGDILIDDWEKYKDLWVQAGGIWVTHTSAVESVAVLEAITRKEGMWTTKKQGTD